METDSAGLRAQIASLRDQLSEVESLVGSDPSNEQFLKLQEDLRSAIGLTEDLVSELFSRAD